MLGNEGSKQVDRLLDVGDACGRDLLKLILNLLLVVLEHLNIGEDILALTSTVVNEVVDGRSPVMTLDTRINCLLKVLKMVTKQGLLVLVDHVLNVVVVANNQHHTLPCDTKLLFSSIQLCNRMRNVAIAKC